MGRKLDLSGLTDDETQHVLQVVQRDFNLRKKEEERLSEMKQRLEEEGSRCRVLSKHRNFVEHCCMRCCSPFTFLLNSRRRCGDCQFNVCKSCCSYQKPEKAWLCRVCQQARFLRTQSLEWFYSNVKSRFKRFGSAKVLKNLYRKHRLESGACSDALGGSFLKQTWRMKEAFRAAIQHFIGSRKDFAIAQGSLWKGHSVMDTLAVALRVAEEAIEEAISKAEASGDSLDKQNEASYLRDHKDELTEELATTILQKIVRKQKNKGEQQADAPAWTPPQRPTASAGGQPAPTALWRSQSAFSLSGEDALKPSFPEAAWRQPRARGQQLPSWRSADRLDGTRDCHLAPVLQGPNGNWVALKDSPQPPTRLPAALETKTTQAPKVASSVTSAYDEVGSDSEEDFDWSEALSKLRPRPQGLLRNPQPCPTQARASSPGPSAASPYPEPPPNPEATCSDSETSSAGSSREAGHWATPSWLHRRPPRTPTAEKRRPQGELDVNFNPQAAGGESSDSSEPEEAPPPADRRARRWRRARVGTEEPGGEPAAPSARPHAPDTHQVLGDLAEAGLRGDARLRSAGTTEEDLRSRPGELAMRMSEKETSSGDEQESEPRTGSETQKESLSSEDNSQSVQEELKKVYLAAGTVYGLEGQLDELEDAARCIHSGTAEAELAELEDQVATAAAQVHQAELQISDIESRISALTVAGLNIAPCVRLTRRRQRPGTQVQTIDSSRQQRRKLPAPPVTAGKTEAFPVSTVNTFNRNFLLQGSLANRTKESSTAGGLMANVVTEPTLEPAVMY